MPHTGNNTFVMAPGVQFNLECNAQGKAANLTLSDWQALGFDLGSVRQDSTSSTLTDMLGKAADMLGMTSQTEAAVETE